MFTQNDYVPPKEFGALRRFWALPAGKILTALTVLIVVGGSIAGVFLAVRDPSGQTGETTAQPKNAEGANRAAGTAQTPSGQSGSPENKPAPAAAAPSGGGAVASGAPAGGAAAGGSADSGSAGGSGSPGGSTGSICSGAVHTAGGSDENGGCWPGAANTGVPAGVTLTAYTGPDGLTSPNTVIDRKIINSDIRVYTTGVKITNSIVNGHIDVDGPYSLTLEDSEVHAGAWQNAAIGFNGVTMRRVEVTGGQTSVLCGTDCVIEDSWLHAQHIITGIGQHLGGYLSNGGSNVQLKHNSIVCDVPDDGSGGGCSGTAQIYGDFSNNTHFTFDRNLFMSTPGGYCTSFGHNPGKPFGDNPANIVVTNNIWQRGPTNQCAVFGATTSFLPGNGSVWSNNKYADGTVLNP